MSTQPPRTIAFEDIRKGDRIRIETVESGVTLSREGIAHEQVTGTWWAEGGGIVADLAWAGDGTTITLLERPAPKEPTGVGAVIWARLKGEAPLIYVRSAPPEWDKDEESPDWFDSNGRFFVWSEFDPDSIEVLHPGIEVDQ